MKYRVLTNRFAEFRYGQIIDLDDEAARVPLENMELVVYVESPVEEVKEVKEVKESRGFECDVCGKLCKNKIGLTAHKRSHK